MTFRRFTGMRRRLDDSANVKENDVFVDKVEKETNAPLRREGRSS